MTGSLLLLEPEAATAPPAHKRRFTVWSGAQISRNHQTIADLAAATFALVPAGVWDEVELLLKAGEGGTWQATFDKHPLAPKNEVHLASLIRDAAAYGIRITPYVVVRGRLAWLSGEQVMINQCVDVADRCVLNVEPGAPYWNGPNDPVYIRDYLSGINARADQLEVCLIPRAGQVQQLGGARCIQAWTDPELVGSASWECYGIAAGQSGSTSLLVDEAIPRLDAWGVPVGAQYRIPVCQRDERARWADTDWCKYGMQVWYSDGN